MDAVEVLAEELEDISLCAQKLWELDTNKLIPEKDYGINVQEGKRISWSEDKAREKLFRGVDESVWKRRTYYIFYNLLDNYVKQTGVAETITSRELAETKDFIDAILETAPMQYVYKYATLKGLFNGDLNSFKSALFQIWFAFYRRKTSQDSCGFEHVFVGESDDGQVKGFHNWIQFFIEESKGNVDYRGYIFAKNNSKTEPDVQERMISLQLAWDGQLKSVSSMFLGSSPEFEMALYTLCFLDGKGNYEMEFLEYRIKIVCYKMKSNNGDMVATCYPELITGY